MPNETDTPDPNTEVVTPNAVLFADILEPLVALMFAITEEVDIESFRAEQQYNRDRFLDSHPHISDTATYSLDLTDKLEEFADWLRLAPHAYNFPEVQ